MKDVETCYLLLCCSLFHRRWSDVGSICWCLFQGSPQSPCWDKVLEELCFLRYFLLALWPWETQGYRRWTSEKTSAGREAGVWHHSAPCWKGTKSPIPKSMLALVINCCGGSQKGRRRHILSFFIIQNQVEEREQRTKEGLEGWSGKVAVEWRSLEGVWGGEGPYGICRI